MDIYSSTGPMAHIVTVPREFHAVSTDPEMFTIHSSDIEEALQNTEMDYYGPLVLHTPFHGEEAFCYIATRTRRYRLSISTFVRPAMGGGVSVCHWGIV